MTASARTPRRFGLRRVAVPVVALLVAAAVATGIHVIATTQNAGALGVAGSVKLGPTTSINNEDVVAQGPNGDLYFAVGKTVKMIKSLGTPTTLLHAPAFVLALDATTTSLFVETATLVAEYTLPSGTLVGTWSLPSGIAPAKLTQAGMSVVGHELWTWTDWATDESGYEYSSITQFNTSTWSSHVIAKNSASPTDATASALGYFYLSHDRFVRGEPSGTQVRSAVTGDASEGSVATWGNDAWLLAVREPSSATYLDTYDATTMVRTASVHLAPDVYVILGTRTGLLGIADVAVAGSSTATEVVTINTRTGSTSMVATIPGARFLLSGPTSAVVLTRGADLYVDRLT